MNEERHASVFIKAGLYLFDICSDWVTGGIMLYNDQLIELKNNSDTTANGTIANDTIARCLDSSERHFEWGVKTIAMSWIPATLTMFYLVQIAAIDGGLKHLITLPLRFILWPLLVPVYM